MPDHTTKHEPAKVEFTPEIDRRIFDGFLGDRPAMIEELGRRGIPKGAVLKRGEFLGLSASFIAKCRAGDVKVAVRTCLACSEPFVSLGAQNRLCKRCRHRT